MKIISRFGVALLGAGAFAPLGAVAEEKPWVAKVSDTGLVTLESSGDEFGQVVPCLFEKDWVMAVLEAGNGDGKDKDGARRGTINAQSGTEVATELRVAKAKDGLKLSYKLTPKAEMHLEGLFVRLNVASDLLIGGKFVADGKEALFPKELKDVHLNAAPTKSLKLIDPKGKTLQMDFAEAVDVIVQDDRQWSEHFVVQIGAAAKSEEAWPAGKSFAVEFTLTAPKGITAQDE